MKQKDIIISDYTYDLPPDRIAYYPSKDRDKSRLLVYKTGNIADSIFTHLPGNLPTDVTLVFNNTRVIEARLLFTKPSGGVIEIFCLEPADWSIEISLQQKGSAKWKCLVGGASKWKQGQVLMKQIIVEGNPVTVEAHYDTKLEDGFIIQFNWSANIAFIDVLHEAGAMPLPPYIKRTVELADKERYQTVFGTEEGSVAAPTAALHFTKKIFADLQQKNIGTAFITLNVGAGTFKPVKAHTIGEHQMHAEQFTVTLATMEQLLRTEKIIAVGTTSLRTLESIYWLGVKLLSGETFVEWQLDQWEAYKLETNIHYKESLQALLQWMKDNKKREIQCRTSILIVPGYAFKVPVALITNFHQPHSTLLLLIAAFIGDDWRKVYDHALKNGYRFLSYGDSSLLWRNEPA